jgi:ABC-type lipoprotein release transport system permease subunit
MKPCVPGSSALIAALMPAAKASRVNVLQTRRSE